MSDAINMKTATTLLAKAQGGVMVKGVLTKKLNQSQVEQIFGKKIPSYMVTGSFKISFEPLDSGEYLVSVRPTK